MLLSVGNNIPDDVTTLVLEVLVFLLLLVMIVLNRRLEAKVGSIKFEMRPNGGSTLRDVVDRLEHAHLSLAQRLDRIEEACYLKDMEAKSE